MDRGARNPGLWIGADVRRLANALVRHIVPLYEDEPNGRPRLHGTGFLVQGRRSSFLVSAAHVLDNFRRLYYFVGPNTKCKVNGRLLLSKMPESNDRKDDRVDVGVLRIGPDALPPYPEVDKVPIAIELLRPNLQPRFPRQYFNVGFPVTRSRANPSAKQVKTEAVAFRNVSASPELYERLGVTEQSHIVLPFDVSRVYADDGSRRASPDPHGISGSPLWHLPPRPFAETRPVQVVGIAIEHFKSERALVFVDINIAVRIMMDIEADEVTADSDGKRGSESAARPVSGDALADGKATTQQSKQPRGP